MPLSFQLFQFLFHHGENLVGGLPPLDVDLPPACRSVAETIPPESLGIDVLNANCAITSSITSSGTSLFSATSKRSASQTPASNCSGVTPATLRWQ